MLIRAKVPENRRYEQRIKRGMNKCGRQCTACPLIKCGNKVKLKNNKEWNINKNVNCDSFNVIYLLECNKDNCRKRYVGETGRQFRFRLADHRGYITNKIESQPAGAHFNLPGHSLANMNATILEQVKYSNEEYRKEREKYFIRKLDTYNIGGWGGISFTFT